MSDPGVEALHTAIESVEGSEKVCDHCIANSDLLLTFARLCNWQPSELLAACLYVVGRLDKANGRSIEEGERASMRVRIYWHGYHAEP